MKTEWDYTILADAHHKRYDYAQEAINRMLPIVCDRKAKKYVILAPGFPSHHYARD